MTEWELLIAVIAGTPGYGVTLLGRLWIYRLENGQYSVTEHDRVDGKNQYRECLFRDPGQAVAFFLAKRTELKLGFDFEVAG